MDLFMYLLNTIQKKNTKVFGTAVCIFILYILAGTTNI